MIITFLKVPNIIVLGDFGISEEFLDLGVPIRNNTVQLDARVLHYFKAPFQAFFLHVSAPTNLVVLLYKTNKSGKGLCKRRIQVKAIISISSLILSKCSQHNPQDFKSLRVFSVNTK